MENVLADNLLYLRKNHKPCLSQGFLAKKLNISTSAYCRYERGQRTPPIEQIERLACIYDISIDSLLKLCLSEGGSKE